MAKKAKKPLDTDIDFIIVYETLDNLKCRQRRFIITRVKIKRGKLYLQGKEI